MFRSVKLGLPPVMLAALVGCSPNYSPNTYSSTAVQQANKVYQAVVIGVRQVAITADGTVGTVTGGAAGGILGSQVPSSGVTTALSALGGTVVGGLVGTTIEHVTNDTTAFEYIVREDSGDLLSVTQKDATPLAVGQKVLVIGGNQARIVPDYSVASKPPPAPAPSTAAGKDEAPAKETPTRAGSSGDPGPAPAPGSAAAETQPASSSESAAPAATQAPAAPPLPLGPPASTALQNNEPPAKDTPTGPASPDTPPDTPASPETLASPALEKDQATAKDSPTGAASPDNPGDARVPAPGQTPPAP